MHCVITFDCTLRSKLVWHCYASRILLNCFWFECTNLGGSLCCYAVDYIGNFPWAGCYLETDKAQRSMTQFWLCVDHLLNTLLFCPCCKCAAELCMVQMLCVVISEGEELKVQCVGFSVIKQWGMLNRLHSRLRWPLSQCLVCPFWTTVETQRCNIVDTVEEDPLPLQKYRALR